MTVWMISAHKQKLEPRLLIAMLRAEDDRTATRPLYDFQGQTVCDAGLRTLVEPGGSRALFGRPPLNRA